MGIFRSKDRVPAGPGPDLRATAESGDSIDDPSEDALFMLLENIQSGDESFVIVERLTDTSGQTYAQVAPNDDGTYVVEHRAGGPEAHFATTAPDMRAAHALLTGWAFELPSWDADVTWSREAF